MGLKRTGAVLLALGLFFTLTAEGCEAEARPTRLGSGQLTDAEKGKWTAPGGPKCTWSVTKARGGKAAKVMASGRGDRKQTVLIFSSLVGGQFNTTGCGTWR